MSGWRACGIEKGCPSIRPAEVIGSWATTHPPGRTEAAIRAGKPQVYDPDLKVDVDSVKNMEDIFRWAGWTNYTTEIPQEKMADTSFAANAVKILGPYKP